MEPAAVTISPITEDEIARYQSFYQQHTLIGWMREGTTTRIIVKMKPGYKGWTPYMCARDCGDHYIIARYDRFDRIDKGTHAITKDVEDR